MMKDVEKKEMFRTEKDWVVGLAEEMEKHKQKVMEIIHMKKHNWEAIGMYENEAIDSVLENLNNLTNKVKQCVEKSDDIDEFRGCLIELLPRKDTAFIIADFLVSGGRRRVELIKKLNEVEGLIDI